EELEIRRTYRFPPFAELIVATYGHRDEARAEREAKSAAEHLSATIGLLNLGDIEVLGPSPAFVYRLKDEFRFEVTLKGSNLHRLVNPEMVKWEGEQIGLEGCLSVPGYVGEVKRYMQVVARGLNRQGKTVKVKGDALLARAIQHEIDHFYGILFTHRLTSLETLRKVEPEEQEKEAELVGA